MHSDGRTPARILIVEDEPMLALDVEQALVDAGFVIAGVAGTLDKALAIIARGDLDAAIVDANLDGISAAPVAAALTARGLPFIISSGYSPEQQPEALRFAPLVEKPCQPQQIIEAFKRILSNS
jgi:DNA-binding NtrC family response regulator